MASFLIPRRFSVGKGEARWVEVEPGIRVLCHCYWQADRVSPLTVVVVHGLEGSTESKYMLGLAEKGRARGMNVVLMNQRTCGGTNALAPTLYHSGRSADVIAVARHLIERDRISRLALCGYSMGGNLVLKAAGEWGTTGPREFSAVAAVSPAVDLAASADALHLAANRIYEQYFLEKLKARMRAKAQSFPGRYDLARLQGLKSLRYFDDQVTAFYCGFEGAADYYARSSAVTVIGRIAVPAFILYAANDPFIRFLPETRRKIALNPNISFLETADGGHCSFLGERKGDDDGHFAEQTVMDFFAEQTAAKLPLPGRVSESEPEMTM